MTTKTTDTTITTPEPIAPIDALEIPEMPAGVYCDPVLGVCTFEGGALPQVDGGPNIGTLSGLTMITPPTTKPDDPS